MKGETASAGDSSSIGRRHQRARARTEEAHRRALRSDFEQNVSRLKELIEREARIADASRRLTGQLGITAAVVASDSSAAAQAGTIAQRGLLRDPKFREHLALRYLAEQGVAGAYRGLLEKAEQVLELTRRALE